MTRWSPLQWPVLRQVRSGGLLGRGPAVTSERTRMLAPRTSTADRVVQSVCPYCAVGCGQRIYVTRVDDGEVGTVEGGEVGREKVVQIEGDPDSPISRGRLCPKGAASEQLVNSPGRQTHVLYRAPRATEGQPPAPAARPSASAAPPPPRWTWGPPVPWGRAATAGSNTTRRAGCCAARWGS